MRLVQKKGPFSAGASFRAGGTSSNEFVHVGIQLPQCQPLSTNIYNICGNKEHKKYDTSIESVSYSTVYKQSVSPDVKITLGTSVMNFYINEMGILEFDGSVGTAVTVTFLKDMPAETVVDLVYKVQGE
jgi:hypothetical protein